MDRISDKNSARACGDDTHPSATALGTVGVADQFGTLGHRSVEPIIGISFHILKAASFSCPSSVPARGVWVRDVIMLGCLQEDRIADFTWRAEIFGVLKEHSNKAPH